MNLLDLIFPKVCVGCGKLGSYICGDCVVKIDYFQAQICPECYKNSLTGKTHKYCLQKSNLDGVISLVNYKSPIRELISQLKYKFATDLVKEFSATINFDRNIVKNKNWTVLPLPLHHFRQNFRGFNQAEVLGKIVSEKLGLKFDDRILKKTAKTKPQVGLGKDGREANVFDAFKVVNDLKEEKYFIFDDVWTSGASLKSAAKTLKKAGAKEVWGLTLAHPR